jgi:AraC-like DNA-binding protein
VLPSQSHGPLRRVGGYRELAPPPGLAHVVDASWVYAAPHGVPARAAGTTHRVLPELGVSLYFECWRDVSGRVTQGSLHLQGPIRRVQLFAPTGSLCIEAIRVKPEWSRELFDADTSEHADGFELFRVLDRSRADRLYDRLMRTTTTLEAIGELAAEVRDRYDRVRSSRALRLAHGAAELIRADARDQSLAGVAHDLSITDRHLRRVMRDATGLGPKQFQRVHRLNRAVAAADGTPHPAWARIAMEAGYYDQSHLIQEFRSITGRGPVALHRERQAENHISPSP